MDRRKIYEQSKDPYRFPLKKIAFYSVKDSIWIAIIMATIFGIILYVFQRNRWQSSIFIPIIVLIPVLIFGILIPLRKSKMFLREQEKLSGHAFAQRTDADLPVQDREWLLCRMSPGYLIFNRNAIREVIGFQTSRVSMTGDGSGRIKLEYIDSRGNKKLVDFRHSEKNKRRFEAWFYRQ